MEKTKNMERVAKGTVKISGCPTVGDEINALTEYYSGRMLGCFIMEKTLENLQKIEAEMDAKRKEVLAEVLAK